MSGVPHSCPVHVGREAALARAWHGVDAGDRRLVFVAGEAGVGKTRLLDEIARRALTEGVLVLRGECTERAQAPYAPITTALRHHTRHLTTHELAVVFDRDGWIAAALLPEVAESLGLRVPSSGLEPTHLFGAVAHLLDRVAIARRVMLVVEDVHWADADTLAMLTHLATAKPPRSTAFLLSARTDQVPRDGHLIPVQNQLRTLNGYTEVELVPLQRSDVAAMIAALIGRTPDDDLVDMITDRSAGNPYAIEELIAAAAREAPRSSGALMLDASAIGGELPVTLRSAVMSRLRALDAGDLAILSVAAVAGERINRRVLAAAAAIPLARVDRALQGATDGGVLVERVDEERSTWAFRHALTREAFLGELDATARRQVHRQVAAAICEIHAGDLDAVAGELGQHYQEADEPAEALTFALRAARHSAWWIAPEHTRAQFDTALRLASEAGANQLPILLEAAEVDVRSEDGHMEHGEALARRAQTLAQQQGARVEEARALALLAIVCMKRGQAAEADALDERALALCGGLDDHVESSVIAMHVSSQPVRVQAALPGLRERGVALAESSGNFTALADLEGSSILLANDPAGAEAALSRALQAARKAGDVGREAWVLAGAGFTAAGHGRLKRARDLLQQSHVLVRPFNVNAQNTSMILAHVDAAIGNLDEAERRASQLRELLPQMHLETQTAALRALVEVHLRRGDQAAARQIGEHCLHLADETNTGIGYVRGLHLRVQMALDDPAARDGVEEFIDGRWPPGWALSPDVAAFLFKTGDRDALRRFVARVCQWTDARRAPQARGPGAASARDYCSGLLALAEGDVDAAAALLSSAARRFADLPMPARHVEALIAFASAQARCGERRQAVATLTEARTIAGGITAWALVRAADEALRALGFRTTSARRALTGNQMEVAALVAAGCSNAEIADRLVMSHSTAANHVSNILTSLQLRNRSELVRWAFENGIQETQEAAGARDREHRERARVDGAAP